MTVDNDEFRSKLLATFTVEAEEHLTTLANRLLELEKSAEPGQQSKAIESAFREAHTLKGAARAVNLSDIEIICQNLEGEFSALKRGELRLAPKVFDELHASLNALADLLRKGARGGKPEGLPWRETTLRTSGTGLSRSADNTTQRPDWRGAEGAAGRTEQISTSSGTVRVTTAKLDALFLQAEELLAAKLAAQRHVAELRESAAAFNQGRRKHAEMLQIVHGGAILRETSLPESASKGQPSRWEKVLQYLEWEDAHLKSLEKSFGALVRTADHDARYLAGRVGSLVDEMKRVLMLPFSSLLMLFPKLVRDLSRQQAKEIEFVMEGGEIEVDKRILEEMKEPLIHLLRNAVDHGIEKPQTRAERKKPRLGRITLAVRPQDSGRFEIRVADDGAGVELERVRAAAVKLGILEELAALKLAEAEVLALMFRSGISANPILTDISGRGLGLAIVQEKVEKLGGTIDVETKPGAGTTFRIVLPVTLSTSRGILIRTGEHLFIILARAVERVSRAGEIRTVENRETVEDRGLTLAFVRLGDILGLPRTRASGDEVRKLPYLILSMGGTRVALQVDEIVGEQEVLVKNPPKPFSRLQYMEGASVLGSGEAVPILSIPDFMRSAAREDGRAVEGENVDFSRGPAKSILVAEDSITARSLLKGILESAGYHVRTAVDGADAFATLKTESFDLVVSDVDMPRMSGFDLTAKIRSDQKLSKTPVVLVTALASREDRERGIDVGADAYIVKSGFDQGNLLEIIQRLI